MDRTVAAVVVEHGHFGIDGKSVGDDFVDGVSVTVAEVHVGHEQLQLDVVARRELTGNAAQQAPFGTGSGCNAHFSLHRQSICVAVTGAPMKSDASSANLSGLSVVR